jgi:hypothetical protein
MTINVPCLTDTDYAVMAGDYEANPPGLMKSALSMGLRRNE